MEFTLKTNIVLRKEFIIEAEHLKDAQEIVQRQVMEELDLNSLEIAYIGYDMTDTSIREYNGKMYKEKLKEDLENGNKH